MESGEGVRDSIRSAPGTSASKNAVDFNNAFVARLNNEIRFEG